MQVGMTHEPGSRGESPSETDRDRGRALQECRGDSVAGKTQRRVSEDSSTSLFCGGGGCFETTGLQLYGSQKRWTCSAEFPDHRPLLPVINFLHLLQLISQYRRIIINYTPQFPRGCVRVYSTGFDKCRIPRIP